MTTYTAEQQHKLDALLRYHVSQNTYFHIAREELVNAFGGDERAAYTAFNETLRQHAADAKRLTAAVEQIGVFGQDGADGADMPCGDDGTQVQAVASVVLPMRQMRKTPIRTSYFDGADEDEDTDGDDWTPSKYDDDTSRYPFRLP